MNTEAWSTWPPINIIPSIMSNSISPEKYSKSQEYLPKEVEIKPQREGKSFLQKHWLTFVLNLLGLIAVTGAVWYLLIALVPVEPVMIF